MGVSIIIVNYNVSDEIKLCIDSIYSNLEKVDFEIIVIDNNSPDRKIHDLKDIFPKTRFKFLENNIGFARANNYGVKLAYYDNILLLNPDTILTQDFVTPILEFINSNHLAGACGPILVYENLSFQNSTGRKMGLFYETAEAFMFIGIYRKIIALGNRKKIKSGKPFKVSWLSGACIILKKKIFEQLDGFDTDFFLNYEDIDLCIRIEESGYKNFCFPSLKCIHLDQTSQKREYSKLVYNRYCSRLIYSKKHYGMFKRLLIRMIHIIGIIIRLASVSFFYKAREKTERFAGYKKSLILYLNIS